VNETRVRVLKTVFNHLKRTSTAVLSSSLFADAVRLETPLVEKMLKENNNP